MEDKRTAEVDARRDNYLKKFLDRLNEITDKEKNDKNEQQKILQGIPKTAKDRKKIIKKQETRKKVEKKLFKCQTCEKDFKDRHGLSRHKSNVESRRKVFFICTNCGKAFGQSRGYAHRNHETHCRVRVPKLKPRSAEVESTIE